MSWAVGDGGRGGANERNAERERIDEEEEWNVGYFVAWKAMVEDN